MSTTISVCYRDRNIIRNWVCGSDQGLIFSSGSLASCCGSRVWKPGQQRNSGADRRRNMCECMIPLINYFSLGPLSFVWSPTILSASYAALAADKWNPSMNGTAHSNTSLVKERRAKKKTSIDFQHSEGLRDGESDNWQKKKKRRRSVIQVRFCGKCSTSSQCEAPCSASRWCLAARQGEHWMRKSI